MAEELRVLLGKRIRQARKEAGLTVEAVAEQVGVVRQAVVFWESGKTYPTIENLKKLASIYGLSVDWLLANGGAPLSSHSLYWMIESSLLAASQDLPPEDMKTILDLVTFMRHRRRRTRLAKGKS